MKHYITGINRSAEEALIESDVTINDISSAVQEHSADEIIAYKKVDEEPIYLGYYFPKDVCTQKEYPVFLFVHGGGWKSHKVFEDQKHWAGDYLGYLARYYSQKGFVCVSIDYRLFDEKKQNHQIIDCYEDCCDAVDYVISHAKEYRIDTSQMYLLGESAGGHLAGGLAAFHYDRTYHFQKVFLINPITHFDDMWKEIGVPRESKHLKLMMLSFEEKAKFISPLYQLWKGVGEIILIHGKEDTTVNPEHSERFYQRMKELGKSCEIYLLEHTSHAFLLAEYYKHGLSACKTAIQIIDKHIEQKKYS